MGKIGILTYFYSINEGAMLQAHALQETCRKLFPNDAVEVVNFQSKNVLWRDFRACFRRKGVSAVIKSIGRRSALNRFKETHIMRAREGYTGDDFGRAVELINRGRYDVLIVGSDEVWKVKSGNEAARGFPNVYWLGPEIVCPRKVSYAASAHKTSLSGISETARSYMARSLDGFSLLGVRDGFTQELVGSLTDGSGSGQRVERVLDPTLLHDFPESADVEPLLRAHGIRAGHPFVVLISGNETVNRLVANYLRPQGYRIVAIGYYSRFADANVLRAGPLEWVGMIRRGAFCVTDRFHGVLFSVKQQVPFMAVDHFELYRNMDSKIKQFLTEIGMSDHLADISGGACDAQAITEKIDRLVTESEWRGASERLRAAKEKSLNFLKKIEELF